MTLIIALTFATAAGCMVVAVATVVVITGVRQEERHQTIARGRPPTIPALLARRVLGTYDCQLPGHQPGPDEPSREQAARPAERSGAGGEV